MCTKSVALDLSVRFPAQKGWPTLPLPPTFQLLSGSCWTVCAEVSDGPFHLPLALQAVNHSRTGARWVVWSMALNLCIWAQLSLGSILGDPIIVIGNACVQICLLFAWAAEPGGRMQDDFVSVPRRSICCIFLKEWTARKQEKKWNKHFVPLICVRSGLCYTSGSSLLLSVHLLVISFFFL